MIAVGSLRLDPATRHAWRADTEIGLSALEFAVLETFMRRPGQVLSQQQLLDAAWDFGYEHRSNVVEVYVRYLREKIDRPFRVRSLETVRGMGYRLREDGGVVRSRDDLGGRDAIELGDRAGDRRRLPDLRLDEDVAFTMANSHVASACPHPRPGEGEAQGRAHPAGAS